MNIPHTPTHFEIPVDDMDRAANFYKELFGWEIKSAGPDFEDYRLVFTVPMNEKGEPQAPGINGGIMKRTDPDQHPINYINVESVDESLVKVEELGGQVLMPKMPVKGLGWNAVVKDTEGNSFGLWQEDKAAL